MQTEEDADQDIEGVKRRFGEQYAKTLATKERLQGENSVLTRDMVKLRQQVDDMVRLSDRLTPRPNVRGDGAMYGEILLKRLDMMSGGYPESRTPRASSLLAQLCGGVWGAGRTAAAWCDIPSFAESVVTARWVCTGGTGGADGGGEGGAAGGGEGFG